MRQQARLIEPHAFVDPSGLPSLGDTGDPREAIGWIDALGDARAR